MGKSLGLMKNFITDGKGLAHPYDFYLQIKDPKKFNVDPTEFNYALQDTSVPSKVYSKQPVYYGGPLRNYPYIATYTGELNCTFLLRRQDRIYNQLQEWHSKVISSDTNIISYPDEYTIDQATLTLKYEVGKRVPASDPGAAGSDFVRIEGNDEPAYTDYSSYTTAEFTLYNIWPESITEIPLSQTGQNEYIRYSVVFCFEKWDSTYWKGANPSNTTTSASSNNVS